MSVLEIIVLALGLSMDSFAVSLTSGVVLQQFRWLKSIKIAFCLALFQALMPLIGWFVGKEFQHYIESYDHWIAFSVLLFLGVRMILEATGRETNCSCCFDPSRMRTLLCLSLATSVDALAVGVSLAFLQIEMVLPTVMIGVVTFVCSIVGLYIGVHFGRRLKSSAEIFGGVILICIGIKILVEHLY